MVRNTVQRNPIVLTLLCEGGRESVAIFGLVDLCNFHAVIIIGRQPEVIVSRNSLELQAAT